VVVALAMAALATVRAQAGNSFDHWMGYVEERARREAFPDARDPEVESWIREGEQIREEASQLFAGEMFCAAGDGRLGPQKVCDTNGKYYHPQCVSPFGHR